MADLTAAELAVVRSHIGSTEPPTNAELDQAWARLDTVEEVALEVIRGRLADMRARPVSLRVDGDFAESWAANLRSLEAQEKQLAAAVDAAAGRGLPVGQMRRVGRHR